MSVLTSEELNEVRRLGTMRGNAVNDLLDTIADLQARLADEILRANETITNLRETADAKIAAAIAPLQAAVDAFFDAAARAHDQSADASRALAEQIRKARLDEANWWQEYMDTNRGYHSALDDPGPRRIAELSREL